MWPSDLLVTDLHKSLGSVSLLWPAHNDTERDMNKSTDNYYKYNNNTTTTTTTFSFGLTPTTTLV